MPGRHLLTFELSEEGDELSIHGDSAGLRLLAERVAELAAKAEAQSTPSVDKLSTSVWGGNELSLEPQGANTRLIYYVKIIAKAPVKPVKPALAVQRNLALEAKVIASTDDDALAVFGDWLQSHGDPWGELIALQLAGKKREAKQFLKQHMVELIGETLHPRMFEWRRGVVDLVRLEMGGAAHQTLAEILELRTTDHRIGLLYRIAAALESSAVTVRWARVVTLGSSVVDSFCIAGSDGHSALSAQARELVERAVLNAAR